MALSVIVWVIWCQTNLIVNHCPGGITFCITASYILLLTLCNTYSYFLLFIFYVYKMISCLLNWILTVRLIYLCISFFIFLFLISFLFWIFMFLCYSSSNCQNYLFTFWKSMYFLKLNINIFDIITKGLLHCCEIQVLSLYTLSKNLLTVHTSFYIHEIIIYLVYFNFKIKPVHFGFPLKYEVPVPYNLFLWKR